MSVSVESCGALSVVVLAAGKGTRMKSRHPKVLQNLGGRAMLAHVLHTAGRLQPAQLVLVTGHEAEQVEAYAQRHAAQLLPGAALACVRQEPQLGTGHAVQQAAPLLDDAATVLVLLGDVPLVSEEALRAVLALSAGGQVALLSVELDDPSGYGRLVRDDAGRVQAIVEEKDASEAQRRIGEINSGIMAFPAQRLKGWLARLGNDNAQGEYYLTDVIAMAAADGVAVQAHALGQAQAWQAAGVNSPAQLAQLERQYQRLQAERLMDAGVRMADPARFELRAREGSALPGELRCGQDVEIDIGCVFSGQVTLGDGARIGAYCHIAQAQIGEDSVVHPYSHIEGGELEKGQGVAVGAQVLIGPFARLRPGAQLGDEVHIGNFVEVKNSTLERGAKANHLAYLGDASVGERVNYGAGVITANYDGANKHRTTIGADVHVGSNSVLVAPVTVGEGGTIGAGSTITRDTPAGSLTVTRAKAQSVPNWQRPTKKKS